LRKDFTITEDVHGQRYFDLIKWCVSHSAQVGFTVSPKAKLSNRSKALIHACEDRGAIKREVTAWPGTVLQSGTAIMYLTTGLENMDTILAAASNLFAWQDPDLPEDLFFLRDDDSALLTTTTHEDHAHLTLDDDELDQIKADLPWITQILQGTDDHN